MLSKAEKKKARQRQHFPALQWKDTPKLIATLTKIETRDAIAASRFSCYVLVGARYRPDYFAAPLALARTGQSMTLRGNDHVNGYLLLAASCDGTLTTTATPTTVRVVSSITVNGATQAIKVSHSMRFDPRVVKKRLGIAVAGWDEFMYRLRLLADRKVGDAESTGFSCGCSVIQQGADKPRGCFPTSEL